jgi:hypothetical protein
MITRPVNIKLWRWTVNKTFIITLIILNTLLTSSTYAFEHKETKVFHCNKDRPNLEEYEDMTEEQKRFYQRLSFVLFEYGKRILLVDAGDNNIAREEGYITCNWENTGKSIQKGSCKPKGGPRIENKWNFFYHYSIINDERRTLKGIKMVPVPFNHEFAGIFYGNHSCDLVQTEKSRTK